MPIYMYIYIYILYYIILYYIILYYIILYYIILYYIILYYIILYYIILYHIILYYIILYYIILYHIILYYIILYYIILYYIHAHVKVAVMTYNLLVFTLAQVPGSKHIFRFWYDEVRGRSQLDLRSNGGVFLAPKRCIESTEKSWYILVKAPRMMLLFLPIHGSWL